MSDKFDAVVDASVTVIDNQRSLILKDVGAVIVPYHIFPDLLAACAIFKREDSCLCFILIKPGFEMTLGESEGCSMFHSNGACWPCLHKLSVEEFYQRTNGNKDVESAKAV